MTFLKKNKTTFFYFALSFLLPATIIFFALLSDGIFWGSKTTILASDGFHQYVIFAQNLRNILHGSDSIFYTFTSGLGLNFYALISYYLGSFLSPFFYFFDLSISFKLPQRPVPQLTGFLQQYGVVNARKAPVLVQHLAIHHTKGDLMARGRIYKV